MDVTIAICTWNRCELLRKTLEQLAGVSVPSTISLEVVVVNNNCTDATDAVIDEFRARLPLRRVFESEPGVTHARNAALAAAAGRAYVIFTDDDVLVDPSWLVEFEAATRAHPEAAALGGVIVPWFPQEPDPDLLAAFPLLALGFCGLDHHRLPGPLPAPLSLWTANAAYRMAALGGMRFDPRFGRTPTSDVLGEEADLLRRLRGAGGAAVWWPSMRVRHYVEPARMTLPYLLRFMRASGLQLVLQSASDSSPCYLGAPRWLWRRCVAASLHQLASHVTGAGLWPYGRLFSGDLRPHASRRVRALEWRREVHFLRGMIQGYRATRAERRSGALGAAAGAQSVNQ